MVELQFATDVAEPDCPWSLIVEAIRYHASPQPGVSAADLNEWADLLEGIAELRDRD